MFRVLRKIASVGLVTENIPRDDAFEALGQRVKSRISKRFSGSVAIREVDAGSCNGCELEVHALSNAFYDAERFGINFVASPRHADILLVTGPVTKHMYSALQSVYRATPAPKWVVAMGDCACGAGEFSDSYAVLGRVDRVIPVDLEIGGCPPTPTRLLQGLLCLLDRCSR